MIAKADRAGVLSRDVSHVFSLWLTLLSNRSVLQLQVGRVPLFDSGSTVSLLHAPGRGWAWILGVEAFTTNEALPPVYFVDLWVVLLSTTNTHGPGHGVIGHALTVTRSWLFFTVFRGG